MTPRRIVAVGWPLLTALWAAVALTFGVAHDDVIVAVCASIGTVGGVIGAGLALKR